MDPEDKKQLKIYLIQNTANALLEAVILRISSFTIISGLAVAFLGVASTVLVSSVKVNIPLLYISILSLLITAVLSLGIFIFYNRKDINKLKNHIKKLSDWDPSESLPTMEDDRGNNIVEFLYVLLVIGLLSFVGSFLNF